MACSGVRRRTRDCGRADASPGLTKAEAAKLQAQVDQVLRESAPGARQISPNRVQWPRDGVTVTLAVRGARAAGLAGCKKHYACLWQDASYRNRRVQFLKYGTYNLRAYSMPPHDHRAPRRTTTTRRVARRRSSTPALTSAWSATGTCTAP
jgi:hypothetical protein